MNILQDRIRGSLVGGAIGDALGYPVEFIHSLKGIQDRYGERGITRLDTQAHWYDEEGRAGKAVVSDDTQMTLFTANGLLNAARLGMNPGDAITKAYLEWYFTQTGKTSDNGGDCWIASVPKLNQRRAPGITCMSSLEDILIGRIPYNNSKGCGGVMRVAPIPLYAAVSDRMTIEEADKLASDAAAVTHKHPLGFISAALAAHVIFRLAMDVNPTPNAMKDYIAEGNDMMRHIYRQYPEDVQTMALLADKAVALVDNGNDDVVNIDQLGEGWVGEEALAIALYCALKYFDNFEDALIAAVNHKGDSDSTGAVAGNILGAALGYEAIPQPFKDDVEMHQLILHMADDLYRGEITRFYD